MAYLRPAISSDIRTHGPMNQRMPQERTKVPPDTAESEARHESEDGIYVRVWWTLDPDDPSR